jgi:hypothetical protein
VEDHAKGLYWKNEKKKRRKDDLKDEYW